MRTYNLAEAATLLEVSLSTLRRWRARKPAGRVGAHGQGDRRRVWLTRAELLGLARAHGKVLVTSPGDGDVAELARDVAELRARVEVLERAVSGEG